MTKTALSEALTGLQPKTKAARLREVMPVIEERIRAGVRLADILQALNANGLELNEATLKSYLYRYRKGRKAVTPPAAAAQPDPAGESSGNNAATRDTNPSGGTVSMQDLERLMKPDPAQQAEDLARYERLGKQRRSKK